MKARMAGLLAVAMAAVWMYAQSSTNIRRMAQLVPPGALLFVEARDFQGLMKDWNQSPEKQEWLRSANYQAFLRSKLLLRLSDVRGSYVIRESKAAPAQPGQRQAPPAITLPDMEMLESAAGGESAVALYDIGKLEFLYVTRMASTRLAASVLWRARDQFESRTAAGQTYYLKSFDQGALAFGTSGDYLLVATREDLLASGTALIAGRATNSLASESWFTDVVSKSTEAGPDLRLAVNQERMNHTPHFRSYWIQDEAKVAGVRAVLSDLTLGAGEWRERRVLLRGDAQADLRPMEAATAQVAARVPANAGYFEASAKPTPTRVRELILEKILGAGGPNAPVEPSRSAPGESLASEPGGEDDLEAFIDRADNSASGENPITSALAPLLDDVDAVAVAGRSRAVNGGVFGAIDHGLVLRRSAGWNNDQVRAALRMAASRLVSTGSTGLDWVPRTNGAALTGLKPVYLAVVGSDLILSNSATLGEEMAAPPTANATTAEPASYMASYAHGIEFASFERLTRLMDFPSLPSNQPLENRAPMYFSENLASLGRVLRRLDRASISVRDDGSQLTQTVLYRRRN